MKKFLSIFAICLGIISWIFFLFLLILAFSPLSLIKSIDQYLLTTHSIEFSELQSAGNALNRNLIFSNLYIMHNDRVLIQAKELEVGFSLKPRNLFNFFNIYRIIIKDGYFDGSNIRTNYSSPSSIVNFGTEISLSFENFKYQIEDSMFEINGTLFGDLSKSISGQLSFLHNDQLSTIAVNGVEGSYRFSLNLYSYEWLNFIPIFKASPARDLEFQINALGEFKEDQSNISGSFKSKIFHLPSYQLNPIKDPFIFSLKKI